MRWKMTGKLFAACLGKHAEVCFGFQDVLVCGGCGRHNAFLCNAAPRSDRVEGFTATMSDFLDDCPIVSVFALQMFCFLSDQEHSGMSISSLVLRNNGGMAYVSTSAQRRIQRRRDARHAWLLV